MAKKEEVTLTAICSRIKKKKFNPIYVLMGEESYYIDYISDLILENALTEDERDFNLSVFYGLDSNVRDVIATCKRYPAMSQYQVVIVREAQMMDNIEVLEYYAKQPLASTILIVCNKKGNIKAPEFMKLAKASDEIIVFESKKLTESSVAKVILEYVNSRNYEISAKSVSMLRDFVGTDVARLFSEIDKLLLLLNDSKEITPLLIEKNIGISKDYNNFELENAIRERNISKALMIANYFGNNPKNNPTVLTTSILFSFFSNLLLVLTSKSKSESALMEHLEMKSPYRIRIFLEAARYYSSTSCVNAISFIREFDTKSKGINSRQNEYELLKELIYKIVHC